MLFPIETKKIALCISGQMRTYENCFQSLKKYILDPFKPDVFIHTWSNRGCTNVAKVKTLEVLDRKRKAINDQNDQSIKEEDLQLLYNPIKIVIEDFNPKFKETIKNISLPNWIKEAERIEQINGIYNSHVYSFLPMYYKIWAANELKKEEESNRNAKYDLVIRFRADQIIGPIQKKCLKNTSVLWCNENVGSPLVPKTNKMQVSDRYAMGSSEIMDHYCSVFENLNYYWRDRKEKNPLSNSWEFPIGDRLLLQHLKRFNVDYDSFGPFAPIYRIE